MIMRYTYILQSLVNDKRFYVGSTSDLVKRLEEHNSGKSIYTNKHKPWKIKTYIGFSDPIKADEFESFLKSGNGRIFQKRHF